jgi:type 1 fimbria pilin
VSADVTNYVDVLSHSATDGGSNDVFSTNQPGAGIRYSFSAPDCSVTDPILKKDTVLRLACLVPGNMARTFIIDVTPSLIATGAPVSAGSFTSAAIIDLTYIHTDTSSLWPQKPMYSGVAQGVLVPSTCSVLSPALNVPMPNISTQAFEGGIGAVSSITPFALKYRCSAGAQLYLTLTDNSAPTNRTDILTLAPDSTASGVSIQITNDSGPISFGPDSAEAGVVNQWKVGASPDGTLDIPLHARYVRTAVITPGSVKARATFTMSFQ